MRFGQFQLAQVNGRQRHIVVRLGVPWVNCQGFFQCRDGLFAIAFLEQRKTQAIEQFHVVWLDVEAALVNADRLRIVAGAFVGHAGAQERVRVKKAFFNARNGIAVARHKLGNIRRPIAVGKAVQNHRRARVAVLVNVRQKQLRVGRVDLG